MRTGCTNWRDWVFWGREKTRKHVHCDTAENITAALSISLSKLQYFEVEREMENIQLPMELFVVPSVSFNQALMNQVISSTWTTISRGLEQWGHWKTLWDLLPSVSLSTFLSFCSMYLVRAALISGPSLPVFPPILIWCRHAEWQESLQCLYPLP